LLAHEAQLADRSGNIDGGGHAFGFAIVDRFELSKFIGMGFEQIGKAVHRPVAGHRGQARPTAIVKGNACSGDGAVNVLVRRVNDVRDDLAA
jgi:hypothetical protein